MSKIVFPLAILAIIISTLASTGCSKLLRTSAIATNAGPGQVAVASTPPGAFEISNVDLSASKAEIALFRQDITKLIRSSDFDGLDAMAKRFREGKDRFVGGGWKIHSFYRDLSAPLDAPVTDEKWQAHFRFLKAWKAAKPESITPPRALFGAYLEYAWFVRGNGWAKDVPASAWPLVRERVELATAEAKGIGDPGADPYGYFENMLVLGTIGQWDRSSFEKVFAEAIAYDPTYQYFYCFKAINLLPRWGGAPGEWEHFADQTKQAIGGEDGLKMYYLIAAEISGYFGKKFFDENQVSWADIRQGFQLSVKEYGTTSFRLNEFGALSINARDPQAACKTFGFLTSLDFDPIIWKNQEGFEIERKTAQMLCQLPRADNMRK